MTGLPANEAIVVRPFRPADAPAVRRICYRTALYGKPVEALISDADWVTEALLGYYLRFEAWNLLVAEAGGRVVGYLSACADTRRSERLYALRVAPRLALRFCLKGYGLRPSLWRFAICSAVYARNLHAARHRVLSLFPAHLHLNLDADWQGRGVGTDLLEHSLASLYDQGVRGIHIFAVSEGGKRFFLKAGFAVMGACRSCSVADRSTVENWLMTKSLREAAA
jgi:GNAT superfamily N-acetyltransferase